MLLRLLTFAATICLTAAAQPGTKPLVILLVGPPASGKTTQADYLHRKYKLPVLTVEKLIEEAGEHGMPRGDPRVSELIRQALAKTDTGSGFILDGYPATRAQAEFLSKLLDEMKLPPPFIVQLEVPDRVVRERSFERGGAEDKSDIIERRLAQYHREMEVIRDYYPEADIWTIDGTRPADAVSQTIRVLIEGRD